MGCSPAAYSQLPTLDRIRYRINSRSKINLSMILSCPSFFCSSALCSDSPYQLHVSPCFPSSPSHHHHSMHAKSKFLPYQPHPTPITSHVDSCILCVQPFAPKSKFSTSSREYEYLDVHRQGVPQPWLWVQLACRWVPNGKGL